MRARRRWAVGVLAALAASVQLAGCASTDGARATCTGRAVPINAPAAGQVSDAR